jgi:transposase
MAHLIHADYSQQFLFPPVLEDWVEPGHPARFIREFVDALDLRELEIDWAPGLKGRPAYAAELLLKVWLYGYFERVRSSRKLEKACRDHLGFIWLAGMHVPDHNTLNNFFRANKKGIRNLFKKTVRVAVEAELVGFVLHAVDGTKIAARVANRGALHKKQLLAILQRLDVELDGFEEQLDEKDKEEALSDALPEALEQRQALRETVRGALKQLEEAGEEHLHPADEDARVMQCKEQNRNALAYNGQAAVDEKSGILVACEATTDCNDARQLNAVIDAIEEQAGQHADLTVADTGYATGPEFQQAEEKGRDIAIALPQSMKPNPDKPFAASNFTLDAERDVVTCPEGTELTFQGARYRKDRDYHLRRYHCGNTACPHRAQCTQSKTGRTIDLTQYHEVIQRQRKRQQDPQRQADLNKRGHLIESVFAFIKQHLGFRRFTLSGLENVRAQWALICATYNLHKLYRHWKSGEIPLTPPGPPSEPGSPNASTGPQGAKASWTAVPQPRASDFTNRMRNYFRNQNPTGPGEKRAAA